MEANRWCWVWEAYCVVDWTAVGAVVAAFGALASAAAALAAYRAADVALRIDGLHAERMANRDYRNALPIALALAREIELVRGLVERIPALLGDQSRDLETRIRSISLARDQYRCVLLETKITDLSCFDARTGAVLAEAFASLRYLQVALRFELAGYDDPDALIGRANEASASLLMWQRPAADALRSAEEALKRFAGSPNAASS